MKNRQLGAAGFVSEQILKDLKNKMTTETNKTEEFIPPVYDDNNPGLFVTDYASYNDGSQFEFGHWVDLTDFSDEYEFEEYLNEHFEKINKLSPRLFREEIMFTDFQNFPRPLYSESYDTKLTAQLFEYINLSDDEKIAYEGMSQILGGDHSYFIDHIDDFRYYEWGGTEREKWDLFEGWFPDAEAASETNPYLTVDYDQFIKENFTEFEVNGQMYLAEDNQF